MIPFPPWLDPDGVFLRRPLDHLRQALQTLTERLRDAVARVLGETVARVVGAVVRTLLATDDARFDDEDRFGTDLDRTSMLWDDPYRSDWPEPRTTRSLPYDDDLDLESAVPTNPPATQRGARALALGCQAAAWWLRRQTGRPQVVVALGIGLATAAAAFVGGPVLAAGAGLAGTAVALATLTSLARRTAAALSHPE